MLGSRDLVSVSSRDPFLRVSVPKVSGFVSVSRRFQISRLSILQRIGLLKFLSFKVLCLLCLQVRNYQNKSEKCQKFEKIQVRCDDDI